jgi:hypothetical protein
MPTHEIVTQEIVKGLGDHSHTENSKFLASNETLIQQYIVTTVSIDITSETRINENRRFTIACQYMHPIVCTTTRLDHNLFWSSGNPS